MLYRSRPAFRIVPLHGEVALGHPEDDALFGAEAVGRSTDGLTSAGHDRILYGEPAQ